MMHKLTIDNLKGHMMYTFLVESVLQGYHEYKDSWPDGLNFVSAALARGWRYFKIKIFAPGFAPLVSTPPPHVCKLFIQKVRVLQNGDKFGWVNIGK